MFTTLYTHLIGLGYHPKVWRQSIGAVLKKPNKSDYTIPKAYRIIALLNCLGKVSEKLIATRLAYLGETTDLLHQSQLGGRKYRSAIDAALILTHDIQRAWTKGNTVSCLMVDIKGAFDHVSKDQLLKVLKELKIPQQVLNWVACFLSDRKISLAFDNNIQEAQKVTTGIPQGSPISPILFLIYIKHLFRNLEARFLGLRIPSYMDDIALVVESKTIKANLKSLEEIAPQAINWAQRNAVEFDHAKSELIHFTRSRNLDPTPLRLPGGLEIKPKEHLRWLGVYFDRKLTWKVHIQQKITSATRTLHLASRLANTEGGLSTKAMRQLYTACVTSVSDYAVPVWWNQQQHYLDKFQKLQNTALRKILGAFKTSPARAMEVEASLPPPKVRFDRIVKNYALRLITLPEGNPIQSRIPSSFPLKTAI